MANIPVPTVGTPTKQSFAQAVADAINARVPDGRQAFAYPAGLSVVTVSSGATTFIAVAAGLGGAVAIPIVLTEPMALQSITIRQGATASLRSCEFALYREPAGGGTPLQRITGTTGTFSFTPAAIDDRTANIATPGTVIAPGTVWLAIRNTSAAQPFLLRRYIASELVANVSSVNNTTGEATLAATLNTAGAAWGGSTSLFFVRLNGRVFGQSTAL